MIACASNLYEETVEIIEVVTPGLFTTMQDLGRTGFRAFGVPTCGAIDTLSHRRANYLVGNAPHEATLEITLQGPSLRFLDHAAISLSGADLSPKLNNIPLGLNETIFVAKGDELTFGKRQTGCRTYLAVNGGFRGKEMLTSISTHVRTSWGGTDGGPLKVGQLLKRNTASSKINSRSLNVAPIDNTTPIRIFHGPETSLIDESNLVSQSWVISSRSDRAALRLEGQPLATSRFEMVSSPMDIGTIELPQGGKPIILLNDGPGVGGYPRVGSIIQADLPRLAQLAPHEKVHFQWVTMEEAARAHKELFRLFSTLGSSPGH